VRRTCTGSEVPDRTRPRDVRTVLLVIGQLHLGGTERQLALLATSLRDAGAEVHVAALYDGGHYEQELTAAGIPVWRGGVARKWQLWKLLPSLLRFYLLLRRLRPDVVHAFLLHSCVIAGPLARAARVPVVLAGRRSLGTFLDDKPVLSLLQRLTTPAFHGVVANATAVAEDVLARERLDPRTVHVIPNALPEHALRPRDPIRPWGDPPVLLTVANLIAYKGHADLLSALGRLRRPVRLRLVGEGPERSRLAELAGRLRLDVELLGARRDVPELLRSSDVFVLPSHEEGMSNALMEAAAAGLPCVATDVGGNREVLGDAGVLCRAHDPDDLARALGGVLEDEPAARALGRRAHERMLEVSSPAALARAHLVLYSRMLEES
jgi:L-malate glycosyltransferase